MRYSLVTKPFAAPFLNPIHDGTMREESYRIGVLRHLRPHLQYRYS